MPEESYEEVESKDEVSVQPTLSSKKTSDQFIERYKSGRKKHLRRCANEIAKSFKCPYADCEKVYGSEGSLNLHMKIKHNAGSKTEREKAARQIIQATKEGQTVKCHMNINLPPGLIEKASQQQQKGR